MQDPDGYAKDAQCLAQDLEDAEAEIAKLREENQRLRDHQCLPHEDLCKIQRQAKIEALEGVLAELVEEMRGDRGFRDPLSLAQIIKRKLKQLKEQA